MATQLKHKYATQAASHTHKEVDKTLYAIGLLLQLRHGNCMPLHSTPVGESGEYFVQHLQTLSLQGWPTPKALPANTPT
jgi:hypothetical protein